MAAVISMSHFRGAKGGDKPKVRKFVNQCPELDSCPNPTVGDKRRMARTSRAPISLSVTSENSLDEKQLFAPISLPQKMDFGSVALGLSMS